MVTFKATTLMSVNMSFVFKYVFKNLVTIIALVLNLVMDKFDMTFKGSFPF